MERERQQNDSLGNGEGAGSGRAEGGGGDGQACGRWVRSHRAAEGPDAAGHQVEQAA